MNRLVLALSLLLFSQWTFANSEELVVAPGDSVKFSLNLASSEALKSLSHSLFIWNGQIQDRTGFNRELMSFGDKFCWIDSDNLRELKAQDEFKLTVFKVSQDKRYTYLENSEQEALRVACLVIVNDGTKIGALEILPFSPKNISEATDGMITVVE